MRVLGVLLAVVPLVSTFDVPSARAVPGTLSIAVDVRATMAWGSFEWHLLTGEVERTWAPFGVTFCWIRRAEGCDGVQVRIRVLIAREREPRRTALMAPPRLGPDDVPWEPIARSAPSDPAHARLRDQHGS